MKKLSLILFSLLILFFSTQSYSQEKFISGLFLLKKSDSISRIIELKEIYKNNGLSEDETFELQQHLLSNIEKLEEPEKKLLRDLSRKAN